MCIYTSTNLPYCSSCATLKKIVTSAKRYQKNHIVNVTETPRPVDSPRHWNWPIIMILKVLRALQSALVSRSQFYGTAQAYFHDAFS